MHKIERVLVLTNGKLLVVGSLLRSRLDRTMNAISVDDIHANTDRQASTMSDLAAMIISQQPAMPSRYGKGEGSTHRMVMPIATVRT